MANIPEYQTPTLAEKIGAEKIGAKQTGAKKPSVLDRFLTTIERVGNKVPHPGIIFLILIGIIIVLSVILGLLGTSVTYEDADPVSGEIVTRTTAVRSLLSAEGIRFMFTSPVANFLGFGVGRRHHRRDDRRGRRRGIRTDRDAGAQDRRRRAPLDLHLHHRDARRRLLHRRRRRLSGAGAAGRRGLPQPRAGIRWRGSPRPSPAWRRYSSSTSS